MSRIAAVILAGGRGERLGGVNKALIEIGGQKLIERAVEAIAGCDPILVAVGRRPFATAGLRQVIDLPGDYAGPLAGVAAAVEALRSDPPKLLLSLAVDTPFFPRDFLRRATSALIGASAVVGAFGAQDYPTNALWRFDAIRTLPTEVRAGTAQRSLKRLAAALSAARLDYLGVSADDPFANVNTPEELAILRDRIA